MIKYLLTEDVLFIHPLSLQVSREDPFFEEILDTCNKVESILDDLDWLKVNLNYNSDTISIEDNGSEAEIFYNGKYHEMSSFFYHNCINLIRNRTSVKREYIANFLSKCLKNPNYSFDDLFGLLYVKGFLFLANGNILVYKTMKETDKQNKNKYFEEVPARIISFVDSTDSSQNPFTVIEVDPSEIEDGIVLHYKIRDVTVNNYLINSYLESYLVNPIIQVIKEGITISDFDHSKDLISNILGRDISEIISRGRLLSIITDRESFKNSLNIISLAIRLCQG